MDKLNVYKNLSEEEKNAINFSIDSGNYFKDAFSWYSSIYIRPTVDRSLLIFVFLISIFIIYNVKDLIEASLPLKEDVYITIREKDASRYQINIENISKNLDTKTTEEDVLKYLLINYVEQRESHNYKTANIADVNTKLKVIENNSSPNVFNEFKNFMGKDNKNGPFYYFGKNVESSVVVNSFNFIRPDEGNLVTNVKDYLGFTILPSKAEIFYTLNIQLGDKIITQKMKSDISFNFSGVAIDKDGKYTPIDFVITSYKNYILK